MNYTNGRMEVGTAGGAEEKRREARSFEKRNKSSFLI